MPLFKSNELIKMPIGKLYIIVTVLSLVFNYLPASAVENKTDCPKLTIQDLKNIHNDKEIHKEGHTWYLSSSYRTRHTALGSNLPLMIESGIIEATKSVEFDKQIEDRICQYKIDIPSQESIGYLLFSKVGK